MYTQNDLISDIKALGVKSNDLITVHISLKSVGPIDPSGTTSAEVMLNALRACVPDGMLMVPTHTFHLLDNNPAELPIFDIRNTMPCVGAVSCVAVKLANESYDRGDTTILRSMKPTHSVVVFGENAKEYICEDGMSAFSIPSFGCYAKLAKRGGKIILIGVDLTKNTFIHFVDDLMDPQPYTHFRIRTVDYNGNEQLCVSASTKGDSSAYQRRYGNLLHEGGALTYGKIGDADVIVCDARKTLQLISSEWDELNL